MKYNIFQKTVAFTRVTAKTKIILDHVITNVNDLKTIAGHFSCCLSSSSSRVACWGQKANNISNCENTNKNNLNIEQKTRSSINYHKQLLN